MGNRGKTGPTLSWGYLGDPEAQPNPSPRQSESPKELRHPPPNQLPWCGGDRWTEGSRTIPEDGGGARGRDHQVRLLRSGWAINTTAQGPSAPPSRRASSSWAPHPRSADICAAGHLTGVSGPQGRGRRWQLCETGYEWGKAVRRGWGSVPVCRGTQAVSVLKGQAFV